jgi:hypothetical protein
MGKNAGSGMIRKMTEIWGKKKAICAVTQIAFNVLSLGEKGTLHSGENNSYAWRRWAVAQSTVGSFGVVMFSPAFDNDLGLTQRIEDFAVQQLIAHPPVKAFAISVFPGRSRLDVGCLGSNCCDPVSDSLSDELWAVTPSEWR